MYLYNFFVKQFCIYCYAPSLIKCRTCKHKIEYTSIFRLYENKLIYISRVEYKSNFVRPQTVKNIDKYKKSFFKQRNPT